MINNLLYRLITALLFNFSVGVRKTIFIDSFVNIIKIIFYSEINLVRSLIFELIYDLHV